jgi:Tol biopolymer transport system component
MLPKPGFCLGSPKWSPDGKRVVFYEITAEHTWGARRPEGVAAADSQIVSVDVKTGERIEHTATPGLKVYPQFLSATDVAYYQKGAPNEGVVYTSGQPGFKSGLRSPAWSPDGKTVVYEKVKFREWTQNQLLYSWDPNREYRYTDVFPGLSRDGKLVITEKNLDSSLAVMNPDGSNRQRVFESKGEGLDAAMIAKGLAGAFAPAWSPDGQWIAFGLGQWFQARRTGSAKIMRVRRDGTGLESLTDGTVQSGFPRPDPTDHQPGE